MDAQEINSRPDDGQFLQSMTAYDTLENIKCIMVTGGEGFVGSWVVRNLYSTYGDAYTIVSFDKLNYSASTNNTRSLVGEPGFHFVRGDITSPDDVTQCMLSYKVDAVIHFAACTHVDSSFKDPYGFAQANINGVHVMLECAKQAGVKRFLHMSSYEVYGAVTPSPQGHVEDSRLAPVNPYAASKAAGETLVSAYGRSSGMETIIVRSQNVYGPNQYPEKIIPKFALLIHRGLRLPLYGSGNNTRRYVYVGDVANAFNTLLHRGKAGEVYNIGSDDEVSNKELCSLLLKAVNPPNCDSSDLSPWLEPTPDRPFHDKGSSLDSTKLRSLGWEQRVRLSEGLQITVEWYKRYGERWWGHLGKSFSPKKGSVAQLEATTSNEN
ncbi:NAD(P)-binding protein [Zopfia rhizophila CBS 207.26]|uniref:NAD(P)-binding protein n=1 Tax=Zopfia rhizophila CBS 207.26 TaxID=1314779 RepID=A0A6A6E0N2_9PEZI|nr:NAD(P)-binding protein [Zopfia rhizophila CBS 207.26]